MCGLRNNAIQKRLLSEANLTLAKAGEIVQGMEVAEKNAKRLQGGETALVNKVIPQGEKDSLLKHAGGLIAKACSLLKHAGVLQVSDRGLNKGLPRSG